MTASRRAPHRPAAPDAWRAHSTRPPGGRELAALRRSLLRWYARRGRTLAFRQPGVDPWSVLVAEVMAQQTQVSRVDPVWRDFMGRFPGPADLAAASAGEAIRAWRGLGYNRRALQLHRAARAIVDAGGRLPDDPDGLAALPGVGPYTARAVAAIAFGRPVGAVDVNVRRVVGRLVAGSAAVIRPAAIQVAADVLVDRSRPATWTHALMDLGATVCRPVRPDCPACPLRTWCRAAGGGDAARSDDGASPAPRRRAAQPVVFEATSRWLRGRLVDRLRDSPAGTFVDLDAPLGRHSAEAARAAVRHLAAEGLVELDGRGHARLPVGPAAREVR